MSSFADYLESAVLNHVFRNTALTSPTTVYVALFTAAPSDTGGGTEVTGGTYARTAVTFGAPSPAGTITQSADVNFPVATASWGTITHYGIFDASTAGNMLAWAPISPTQAIAIGQQAKFASGQIIITLS